MTAESARRVAWSVGISSIVLMVAGLVFRFLDRSATLPQVSDAWSVGGVFEVVATLDGLIGFLWAKEQRARLPSEDRVKERLLLGIVGFL